MISKKSISPPFNLPAPFTSEEDSLSQQVWFKAAPGAKHKLLSEKSAKALQMGTNGASAGHRN